MFRIARNLMPEGIPFELKIWTSDRKPAASFPSTEGQYAIRIRGKRVVQTTLLAATLMLSSMPPALAQLPPVNTGSLTTSPLTSMVKHQSVTIALAPAQRVPFAPPIWPGGTLLHFRYKPAVMALLSPMTVRQALTAPTTTVTRTPAKLSITVTAGTRVFTATPDASGTRWKVILPALSVAPTAVAQNVSTASLSGTLIVESFDQPALTTYRRTAEVNRLIDTARTVRYPDLMYAITHMLERHFLNYPGGMSSVESRIQQAVLQGRITSPVLRAMQGKFSTMKKDLAARVIDQTMLQVDVYRPLPETTLKRVFTFATKVAVPATARYSIRILGVKSWRCADDVGAEVGCDREEPYLSWMAFGPSFARVNRTEQAEDVRQYNETFYSQGINVYSAGEDNWSSAPVVGPLGFFYQVIESDPDGPTREEFVEALNDVVELVRATFGGNLEGALNSATGAIIGIYDAIIGVAGAGDDRYQMLWSLFTDTNLKALTSGTTPAPLDRPIFESAGNYQGMSIRVADVYNSSGGRQWSVAYAIYRQ